MNFSKIPTGRSAGNSSSTTSTTTKTTATNSSKVGATKSTSSTLSKGKAGSKNNVEPEEVKNDAPKTGLFTTKPSAKLTSIKTSDPFAPKKTLKTNSFAYVYNAGGIPCRIMHGSVNNKLKWNADVNIDELSFDPLLVTCFEGLIETTHPFNFIAREASMDLLSSNGAGDKVFPLLTKLINPLRAALGSSDNGVFEGGLAILKMLSDLVGDALNEHLNGLLGNLIRKMNNKKYKEIVIDTLHSIEENGGPGVGKLIKQKIPTYTSIL